jgi:hypothetical protein
MLHREYMAARARRWEEREAFRRLFRRRHPSVAVRYLAELHDGRHPYVSVERRAESVERRFGERRA